MRALFGKQFRQPRHRFVELVLGHGQACGHFVSATLDQQALGCQPLDRGTQVDPRDRAPGSFPDAILEPDHNRRTVRRLFQTGRNNAHHAGVPARARRPNQRRVIPACFRLIERSGAYGGLYIAPLGVQQVELFSKGLCLVRVIAGQQSRTEIGLTNATTCVDSGAQQKPKVIGRGGRIHACHIGEGRKTDPVAPRHNAQSLTHKSAVDADQRSHIRHRGQPHQIQHRHQVGPACTRFTQLTPCLDQHQEYDRRRT